MTIKISYSGDPMKSAQAMHCIHAALPVLSMMPPGHTETVQLNPSIIKSRQGPSFQISVYNNEIVARDPEVGFIQRPFTHVARLKFR